MARNEGKTIIFGYEGIIELCEPLISMPRSELDQIMNLAIDRKLARWVESKNQVLKLI